MAWTDETRARVGERLAAARAAKREALAQLGESTPADVERVMGTARPSAEEDLPIAQLDLDTPVMFGSMARSLLMTFEGAGSDRRPVWTMRATTPGVLLIGWTAGDVIEWRSSDNRQAFYRARLPHGRRDLIPWSNIRRVAYAAEKE
jgi:hypothetical protein